MEPGAVDAADSKLRDRLDLDKRIINNNESLLKIDCALSEPLRFEHHEHRDDYLIGSVLIADSVEQVETATTKPLGVAFPIRTRRCMW